MTRPDPDLMVRAASCYQRLGEHVHAARCFREAGSYRRAAELHEGLGRHRDAAQDYARAGLPDVAGWLLVHHAGAVGAAREQLERTAPAADPTSVLRRRLVEARCDVAEGRGTRGALELLADVCAFLAGPAEQDDLYVERWAVGLAEAMDRDDQVALVFAAAVRGGRADAEQRWRAWMSDVLHTELVLPARPQPSVVG